MYIKQLECFVQLAETLNFTTTAELLYISQPAVTHQIRTLEDEIGLKLFIRTKRTVELTPAGISFYNDIKDVLTKTNIAIAKARNYAKDFKSNLSIGYEGNLLELEMMSRIFKLYKEAEPSVHLYIKHADYKECKNSLLSQKLDIIFTVKENIKTSSEINFEQLFSGRFVCVLPQEHPLAMQRVINIKELQNESLILLDSLKCPPEMARIQNNIQLLCPNSTTYFSDSAIISYTMIKGNIGVAVMPNFVCPKDDHLKVIPLDITDTISYGIAWYSNNTNLELTHLIKIAKNVFLH